MGDTMSLLTELGIQVTLGGYKYFVPPGLQLSKTFPLPRT